MDGMPVMLVALAFALALALGNEIVIEIVIEIVTVMAGTVGIVVVHEAHEDH